jgi:hypothetical protein
MKNVHILPTDKPSRLHIDVIDGSLCLFSDNLIHKPTGLHIYITSDEEIKEGDKWIYNTHWNEPQNIEEDWVLKILNESSNTFKIILTTDQDLITDGVQAIDDEFLEWFVKNSSCEFVEILIKTKTFDKDGFINSVICDTKNVEKIYSIIPQEELCSFCNGTGQIVSSTKISGFKTCDCINIPQEEPKQELNLNCFDCNKALQDCTCMEDTIDMTDPLEQAAKEYAEMHLDVSGNLGKYLVKAVFQDGANYQAKRSYSEEELLEFANWCRIQDNKYPNWCRTIQQLFTQFKKK